jgi:hypothetical protein
LLIAFDPEGRVLKSGTERHWLLSTVRSHPIKWIEREGLDVPKPPDEFVELEIPKGKAGLYIYQWGGWGENPFSGKKPAVKINGDLIAEIRKGNMRPRSCRQTYNGSL